MADPNFIILYVDSPTASAAFYATLLGKPPVESSATFAMFALPSGVVLGLWSRYAVEPAPAPTLGGGGEVAFAVESRDQVTSLYDAWMGRGLRVAQEPVDMDFGHTFVALDPDGHRLRVFAAAA